MRDEPLESLVCVHECRDLDELVLAVCVSRMTRTEVECGDPSGSEVSHVRPRLFRLYALGAGGQERFDDWAVGHDGACG